MPIKIPNNLPGRKTLEQEHVPLILEDRALRQDIRPLQIAILNLMPDKEVTETQLLRALGLSPLQIEITLLHAGTHQSRNTPQEHLTAFYRTHEDVKDKCFDALIVTGAPVGHLPYEEVGYWPELTRIFDWARTHVYSSLSICWGAMAGLYHYEGIDKRRLARKRSGIYRHRVVNKASPLVAGFDDFFDVPVSRHTEVSAGDIAGRAALEVLVEAPDSGVFIVEDKAARRVYILNHLEYDAETLQKEYQRDLAAGLNPQIPHNYFPANDPRQTPQITWRAHRTLLFTNWVNAVYQGTPYDLSSLVAQEAACAVA
ncbi:MAG: homoserine O-succinyltransferase [Alphaproteobacteria bacterium]|nr:homoserine O-succinyltransferase [Alphaproteobacteria bacterium]